MRRKKKSKIDGTIMKRSGNTGEKVLAVLLIAAVVCAAGYGVYYVVDNVESVRKHVDEINTEVATESTSVDYGFDFTFEPHNASEVYSGDLILVNNQTKLQDPTLDSAGTVSLYNEALNLGKDENDMPFSVTDTTVSMRKDAADNLIEMLSEFYKEKGLNDILACSGYRSDEEQKALYDEDLAETGLDYSEKVALPGYSEHESGYAIDFDLNGDDREYDGTGDYHWIDENCAKYGFILRYPKGKTDITEIEYEPWHYRYVGVPHATYIMENNICLEEYLDQLKTKNAYTDSGLEPLEIKADEDTWEVYYYGVDVTQNEVYVPVPDGKDFTISGNNTDGFVIAFKK